MKISRILRIAWEGLTINKVRTFLTTLGVIIGVAAVIVMLAVSAGAEAAIADQINALGANLVIVSSPRGVPRSEMSLTLDDAQVISQQVPGILGVSAEQNGSSQVVKAGGASLSEISLLGTTADFPGVRDYPVAEGRYFTDQEDQRKTKIAVLGAGLARDLFGDLSPVGETITVGSTRLTVIGVMASKGMVGETDFDGRVYLPISLVFDRFSPSGGRMSEGRVRSIYVMAESQESIPSVIAQISYLLAERHDLDPSRSQFVLQTQEDIIATQEAATAAFRSLLTWVAAVSLLVGGIGIMNIMLVSVTERTREIGLRQALGARPGDVLYQFLFEAVILSLSGGLVGVLAGVGGAYLFGMGEMRTEVVPLSIPLAFGAAALVGIFFGYYPAVRAAKLEPIEALRRE
jgi:putative ABC transport system permease protein